MDINSNQSTCCPKAICKIFGTAPNTLTNVFHKILKNVFNISSKFGDGRSDNLEPKLARIHHTNKVLVMVREFCL